MVPIGLSSFSYDNYKGSLRILREQAVEVAVPCFARLPFRQRTEGINVLHSSCPQFVNQSQSELHCQEMLKERPDSTKSQAFLCGVKVSNL